MPLAKRGQGLEKGRKKVTGGGTEEESRGFVLYKVGSCGIAVV